MKELTRLVIQELIEAEQRIADLEQELTKAYELPKRLQETVSKLLTRCETSEQKLSDLRTAVEPFVPSKKDASIYRELAADDGTPRPCMVKVTDVQLIGLRTAIERSHQ